jgi:threonine synthase
MPDLFNRYYFECCDCGKQFLPHDTIYLCPKCASKNSPDQVPKGVLYTFYDYAHLRRKLSYQAFVDRAFLDLLPIANWENWPGLRIGQSPLYKVENKDSNGVDLYLKDDAQNPSFSFKDRASALVSAYAKERGMDSIVTASTGNAGSSLAAICANQGQRAIVMVPESAPVAKLIQIYWYGATIVPVKGTYDAAFDLSIDATEEFGWYNRNTAYNPLTIEGKKTVAFELYQQMNGKLPDNIFVPVGDGVIISGVYKGFEDLLKMGWIENIPHLIAVQSANSDNLIRNLNSAEFIVNDKKSSVADSITVKIPRNFRMTQHYLEKYQGSAITVSDQAILEASSKLSKRYGLFSEPAAAAAYAAYLKGLEEGLVSEGSSQVILLTGSGLKDIEAVRKRIDLPEAIDPDIDQLNSLLND